MSNWMNYKINKNTKIKDIKFPGTHDSGAYNVDLSCFVKIKGVKYIKLLTKIINKIPFISNFIKKWTITQDKNIYDQLNAGIRSLDIRISSNNNIFYISHTFVCIKFIDALEQIKNFITENPSEIIIINIKPDYPNRHVVEPLKNDIMYLVNLYLNKYIISNKYIYNKSYDEIINNNKNIIFFYKGLSNGLKFKDYWMNKTKKNEWLQKYNNTILNTEQNKIKNIQLTLTPNIYYIITHPFGSLKKLKNKIDLDLLNDKNINFNKFNIISSDFINNRFIIHIINMN
jgi:hypothetical protein